MNDAPPWLRWFIDIATLGLGAYFLVNGDVAAGTAILGGGAAQRMLPPPRFGPRRSPDRLSIPRGE